MPAALEVARDDGRGRIGVAVDPYWTAAWRRIRRLILERDGHRCTLELPGCQGVATQVDHVVPRRFGGTDEPANLRASCARCNRRRGDGTEPVAEVASAW
jgi:5-methylcytosine-specific restriction endonuclease McrA